MPYKPLPETTGGYKPIGASQPVGYQPMAVSKLDLTASPLSFADPFGKTQTSTPLVTTEDTKSVAKKAGTYLFDPAGEVPAPKIPFATPEEQKTVPNFVGPRAVTGPVKILSDMLSYTLESIPNVAIRLKEALNMAQGKEGTTKLPFNPARIGIKDAGDNTTTPIFTEALDRLNQLDEQNPDHGSLNLLQAFGETVVPQAILNPLVAGDALKGLTGSILRLTRSSPELGISAQSLKGLTPQQAVAETSARFISRARQIVDESSILAEDGTRSLTPRGTRDMQKLVSETRRLGTAFSGDTIPELNPLGKFFDQMSIRLNQNIGNLGVDTGLKEASQTFKADEALPGYRRRPGQAPAMGLSTTEVEPVGFGDAPKKAETVNNAELVAEAKTYENAQDFEKAIQYHGLSSGGRDEILKQGFRPANEGVFVAGKSEAKDYGDTMPVLIRNGAKNLETSLDGKVPISGTSYRSEDIIPLPQNFNAKEFYNQAVGKSAPLPSPTEGVAENKAFSSEGSGPVGQGRGVGSDISIEQKIDTLAEKIRSRDVTLGELKDAQKELLETRQMLEVAKYAPAPFEGEVSRYAERYKALFRTSKGKKIREKLVNGDLPEIEKALKSVGINPEKSFLENQSDQMTQDEQLDLVRDHLQRENPDLLYGRKNRKALGITTSAEENKAVIDSLLRKVKNLKATKAEISQGDELLRAAMSDRRARFRILKNRFDLTDASLRDLKGGKDFSIMTPKEFDTFLQSAEKRAGELEDKRKARIQLEGTIEEKQLKNVENLQRALELPQINEMSTEQLKQFDQTLSKYKTGDEFLTQRKIELIDNTDLSGSRTYREAKEKLAQKFGVSVERLDNIKIGHMHRNLWDTALAESDPFFKHMVQSFNSSLLKGEATVIDIEHDINHLFKDARKGADLAHKAIPTDEAIMHYLESNAKNTKELTPAQLKAAEYLRKYFNQAYNYMLEHKVVTGSRFGDTYYPHMRRGILEASAEKIRALRKGDTVKSQLVDFFGEVIKRYKEEKQAITILDQKTGQVLPLEKFFRNSLFRQGELNPSKNAAKVFMQYVKTFETKKALDRIVPEIMTYVDVVTPRAKTGRGLTKDDSLATFVKEWINNKKGRKAHMFIPPGSPQAYALKTVSAYLNLSVLGLKVPLQLGSNLGEQAAIFTVMGPQRYATGVKRLASRRGQAFVKKYQNYTGQSPWSTFSDATKNLSDKAMTVLFGLFRDATVRADRIHLLGSLTPKEWQTGNISTNRLAELKTEIGRWKPVEKSESILGSTVEGKVLTQFKKWTMPPIRTSYKNIQSILKKAKNGEWKDIPRSREFKEQVNAAVFTGAAALIAYGVIHIGDGRKDSELSTLEKILRKSGQDALSLIQAWDPRTLFSTPTLINYLNDFGQVLGQIVTLEKYKTTTDSHQAGDLKGPSALKKFLTPGVLKNSAPSKEKAQSILDEYGIGDGQGSAADILKEYGIK